MYSISTVDGQWVWTSRWTGVYNRSLIKVTASMLIGLSNIGEQRLPVFKIFAVFYFRVLWWNKTCIILKDLCTDRHFRLSRLHNRLSANRFNFALLQLITLAYNCNRSVCPERNAGLQVFRTQNICNGMTGDVLKIVLILCTWQKYETYLACKERLVSATVDWFIDWMMFIW